MPADAPRLGANIAIDSTDSDSFGNPKRKTPADPDATWGHRTTKRGGKEKTEPFYGCKNHEAADAYYGLPLCGIALSACEGDGPQLPPVMTKLKERHPRMNPEFLMADKGYHGLSNFQFLDSQGITPIIALPRPRRNTKTGKRLHQKDYDEDGRPTSSNGVPMDYIRADPDKGHMFLCSAESYEQNEGMESTGHCDFERWERPQGRLLRIIGLTPRLTTEWKSRYRLRSSIESYFRRAKHSRLLNQHQHLGIEKAGLHVSMSRLEYLATSLAHLKANDYAGMRHMRVKLPTPRIESQGPTLRHNR